MHDMVLKRSLSGTLASPLGIRVEILGLFSKDLINFAHHVSR